jgi:ParB family chromosome partitioning protein
MVKAKGLGKGMAALLPVMEEETGRRYFSCPIEKITPNKSQPRKTFSLEKLEELAASIREKGIIQPLVVRVRADRYELIAGERRWRAAQKAGLHEVPVVIQDVSDDAALEMALIENIQREDLNAVEEAEAFHALMEKFVLTQEEMARRVGKDRSTVANSLRLLRLPAEIKGDIIAERLAMGHARALLALDSAEQMRHVRDEILRKRLTVRATEALIKRLREQQPVRKPKKMEHHLLDLTERLKRRFATKVHIRQSGRGGKLEIAYSSRDELTRIIDLLGL